MIPEFTLQAVRTPGKYRVIAPTTRTGDAIQRDFDSRDVALAVVTAQLVLNPHWTVVEHVPPDSTAASYTRSGKPTAKLLCIFHVGPPT